MALPAVELLDPRWCSFYEWSARVYDELAEYNVPLPVQEPMWPLWAREFCQIPDVAELSPNEPRFYATWKAWAINLQQVLP